MKKNSFAELGVKKEICTILDSINYLEPTPVQNDTIPIALSGRDLIGQAETGSGKTAACAIPAAQLIDVNNKNPQVLVLTPTRELAKQYLQEFHSIASPLGINCFVVYGGFDRSIQTAKLKDGVHVVVATTGRIMDLIYSGDIDLSQVKLLVLDEADEMLDMGFIKDIEFVLSCLVQDHQTLLFSATMPAPIKKLAKKYIKDPVHIILNDNKKTPENLKHFYVYTRPEEKTDCVSTILKEHNITQALIFCNTRKTVETLFKKLYKAGFDIKMLHGGVEQKNRDHVAGSFKCGELKYIVATDIMARGLDYDNITHIIHFDLPNDKETYIHRSGRAARLGRDGEAVSILTKRDKRYFDQYMKSTSLSASELVVNFKISSDSLSKTGKSKNNLKSNSKSNSKSKPINKSLSKTKNDIKSKSNSNTQTRKKSGPSQRKIEKSPQPVSADSGSTKEFFSSKKIIKRKK